MHSQVQKNTNHNKKFSYVLEDLDCPEFRVDCEIQWGIHKYKPWGKLRVPKSLKPIGRPSFGSLKVEFRD